MIKQSNIDGRQLLRFLLIATLTFNIAGAVAAQSIDDAKSVDRTRANAKKFANVEKAATELVDAAEERDWTRCSKLLDSQDNVSELVHAAQADGMTALHWAVWHEQLPVVEKLLALNTDIEAANRYGVRPLSIACLQGSTDIAMALLDHGANPNARSADGESALMLAARAGNLEIVRRLIAGGADVQAKERKGQTALVWAAAEGQTEVVDELILRGADFRAALSSGFTPLLLAAREGHVDVARTLVKRGADVNEQLERDKAGTGKMPRKGTSPLVMAVENGHFDLAAELLKLGADPNDQRSGFTALHTLTWVRKPNRGDGDDGDPSPIGSGRMTSLQLARVLKASGADVNARLSKGAKGRGQLNRQGATPFLLAAFTDDLPYMRLLVELGADPHLTNEDGCTALMAAAGIGVLAPGEEAGSEEEALACVEYLRELGLSVNTVDENGETAMHGAAYKSLPRMVEYLNAHGADATVWNRPNKYGWTPLAIAEGHRPGNFKPHEPTQSALRNVLR